MITPGHFKSPSAIYQRTGDVREVIPTNTGCGQSRETSRPRISALLQPAIAHIDVPTGIVLRKQLYSESSEPPDDDYPDGIKMHGLQDGGENRD